MPHSYLSLTASLQYTTNRINTTKADDLTTKNSPPPIFFSSGVELVSEKITGKELEFSQHLFNIHSTNIQHHSNVGLDNNSQTACDIKNTEPQEFIQHITRDEGEREIVEIPKSDNVLQILPKQEQKSVEAQTQKSPPRSDERSPFQVGERIIDILTKIQGIVVAVKEEKVFFYCREFGRVWRWWELLVKIKD